MSFNDMIKKQRNSVRKSAEFDDILDSLQDEYHGYSMTFSYASNSEPDIYYSNDGGDVMYEIIIDTDAKMVIFNTFDEDMDEWVVLAEDGYDTINDIPNVIMNITRI